MRLKQVGTGGWFRPNRPPALLPASQCPHPFLAIYLRFPLIFLHLFPFISPRKPMIPVFFFLFRPNYLLFPCAFGIKELGID